MATLKDVVGKLEENNQKLGNIDTSIDKVEAGILGLFGLQKRAQLDQLEAAREAGQSAKNVATLGNEPKGKAQVVIQITMAVDYSADLLQVPPDYLAVYHFQVY